MQTSSEQTYSIRYISLNKDNSYNFHSKDFSRFGTFHYVDSGRKIATLIISNTWIKLECTTAKQVNIFYDISRNLFIKAEGKVYCEGLIRSPQAIRIDATSALLTQEITTEGMVLFNISEHLQTEGPIKASVCRINSPIWIQANDFHTSEFCTLQIDRYVQKGNTTTTCEGEFTVNGKRCKIEGNFTAHAPSTWNVEHLSLGKSEEKSVLKFLGDEHHFTTTKIEVQGSGDLNNCKINTAETLLQGAFNVKYLRLNTLLGIFDAQDSLFINSEIYYSDLNLLGAETGLEFIGCALEKKPLLPFSSLQLQGQISFQYSTLTAHNLFLNHVKLRMRSNQVQLQERWIQQQSTANIAESQLITAGMELDGAFSISEQSSVVANEFRSSKTTRVDCRETQLNLGSTSLFGPSYFDRCHLQTHKLPIYNLFSAEYSKIHANTTPTITDHGNVQLLNSDFSSDRNIELFGKFTSFKSNITAAQGKFQSWRNSELHLKHSSTIQAKENIIRGTLTTESKTSNLKVNENKITQDNIRETKTAELYFLEKNIPYFRDLFSYSNEAPNVKVDENKTSQDSINETKETKAIELYFLEKNKPSITDLIPLDKEIDNPIVNEILKNIKSQKKPKSLRSESVSKLKDSIPKASDHKPIQENLRKSTESINTEEKLDTAAKIKLNISSSISFKNETSNLKVDEPLKNINLKTLFLDYRFSQPKSMLVENNNFNWQKIKNYFDTPTELVEHDNFNPQKLEEYFDPPPALIKLVEEVTHTFSLQLLENLPTLASCESNIVYLEFMPSIYGIGFNFCYKTTADNPEFITGKIDARELQHFQSELGNSPKQDCWSTALQETILQATVNDAGKPTIVCQEFFALRSKQKISGDNLIIKSPKQEFDGIVKIHKTDSEGHELINYKTIHSDMNLGLNLGFFNLGGLFGNFHLKGGVFGLMNNGYGVFNLNSTSIFSLNPGLRFSGDNHVNAFFSIGSGASLTLASAKKLYEYSLQRHEKSFSQFLSENIRTINKKESLFALGKIVVSNYFPKIQETLNFINGAKGLIHSAPEFYKNLQTLRDLKQLKFYDQIDTLLQTKSQVLKFYDVGKTFNKSLGELNPLCKKATELCAQSWHYALDTLENRPQEIFSDLANLANKSFTAVRETKNSKWKNMLNQLVKTVEGCDSNESIFHIGSGFNVSANTHLQNFGYLDIGYQQAFCNLDIENWYMLARSLNGGRMNIQSHYAIFGQHLSPQNLVANASTIIDLSNLHLANGSSAEFNADYYEHYGAASESGEDNLLKVTAKKSAQLKGSAQVQNGDYEVPTLENSRDFYQGENQYEEYKFSKKLKFTTTEQHLEINEPLKRQCDLELGAKSIKVKLPQNSAHALVLNASGSIEVTKRINAHDFIAKADGDVVVNVPIQTQGQLKLEAGGKVYDLGADLQGSLISMHGEQGVYIVDQNIKLPEVGLEESAHIPEQIARQNLVYSKLAVLENFSISPDKTNAKRQARLLEPKFKAAQKLLSSNDPDAENLQKLRKFAENAQSGDTDNVHRNLQVIKNILDEMLPRMKKEKESPPGFAVGTGNSITASQNANISTGDNANIVMAGGIKITAPDTTHIKPGGDLVVLPGKTFTPGKKGPVHHIQRPIIFGGTGKSNNGIGLNIRGKGNMDFTAAQLGSFSKNNIESTHGNITFHSEIESYVSHKIYKGKGFFNGRLPRALGKLLNKSSKKVCKKKAQRAMKLLAKMQITGKVTEKTKHYDVVIPCEQQSVGGTTVIAHNGKITGDAFQSNSSGGTTMNAKQGVTFKDVTTQTKERIRVKDPLKGKSNSTHKNSVSTATHILDKSNITIHTDGEINFEGTQISSILGNVHFRSPKKVVISRPILDHSVKHNGLYLQVHFPGSNALAAFMQGKNFKEILQSESAALTSLESLFKKAKAKDLWGYLQENLRFSCHAINEVQAAMQLIAGNSTTEPSKPGETAKLNTKSKLTDLISLTFTHQKGSQHYQTLGEGNVYAGLEIIFESPEVTINNAAALVAGKAINYVGTKKLTQNAAVLKNSQWKTTRSVTVKPSFKSFQIGAGYKRERSSGITHINQQSQAPNINYGDMDTLIMNGAHATADKFTGNIRKAIFINKQDKSKFKAGGASANSDGHLSFDKEYRRTVKGTAQTAGLHSTQSIDSSLKFGEVDLDGAQITSNQRVDLYAGKITAKTQKEHHKEKGFGFAGNPKDIRRLNPKRQPQKGEKPIALWNVKYKDKDKIEQLKSVVSGKAGTTIHSNNITGELHTQNNNGRKTEHEHSVDIDTVIPLTNKKSLAKVLDTSKDAFDKIKESLAAIIKPKPTVINAINTNPDTIPGIGSTTPTKPIQKTKTPFEELSEIVSKEIQPHSIDQDQRRFFSTKADTKSREEKQETSKSEVELSYYTKKKLAAIDVQFEQVRTELEKNGKISPKSMEELFSQWSNLADPAPFKSEQRQQEFEKSWIHLQENLIAGKSTLADIRDIQKLVAAEALGVENPEIYFPLFKDPVKAKQFVSLGLKLETSLGDRISAEKTIKEMDTLIRSEFREVPVEGFFTGVANAAQNGFKNTFTHNGLNQISGGHLQYEALPMQNTRTNQLVAATANIVGDAPLFIMTSEIFKNIALLTKVAARGAAWQFTLLTTAISASSFAMVSFYHALEDGAYEKYLEQNPGEKITYGEFIGKQVTHGAIQGAVVGLTGSSANKALKYIAPLAKAPAIVNKTTVEAVDILTASLSLSTVNYAFNPSISFDEDFYNNFIILATLKGSGFGFAKAKESLVNYHKFKQFSTPPLFRSIEYGKLITPEAMEINRVAYEKVKSLMVSPEQVKSRPGEHRYLYIIDKAGDLKILPDPLLQISEIAGVKHLELQHIDLANAQDVIAAGEFFTKTDNLKNTKIIEINNKSGSYLPTGEYLETLIPTVFDRHGFQEANAAIYKPLPIDPYNQPTIITKSAIEKAELQQSSYKIKNYLTENTLFSPKINYAGNTCKPNKQNGLTFYSYQKDAVGLGKQILQTAKDSSSIISKIMTVFRYRANTDTFVVFEFMNLDASISSESRLMIKELKKAALAGDKFVVQCDLSAGNNLVEKTAIFIRDEIIPFFLKNEKNNQNYLATLSKAIIKDKKSLPSEQIQSTWSTKHKECYDLVSTIFNQIETKPLTKQSGERFLSQLMEAIFRYPAEIEKIAPRSFQLCKNFSELLLQKTQLNIIDQIIDSTFTVRLSEKHKNTIAQVLIERLDYLGLLPLLGDAEVSFSMTKSFINNLNNSFEKKQELIIKALTDHSTTKAMDIIAHEIIPKIAIEMTINPETLHYISTKQSNYEKIQNLYLNQPSKQISGTFSKNQLILQLREIGEKLKKLPWFIKNYSIPGQSSISQQAFQKNGFVYYAAKQKAAKMGNIIIPEIFKGHNASANVMAIVRHLTGKKVFVVFEYTHLSSLSAGEACYTSFSPENHLILISTLSQDALAKGKIALRSSKDTVPMLLHESNHFINSYFKLDHSQVEKAFLQDLAKLPTAENRKNWSEQTHFCYEILFEHIESPQYKKSSSRINSAKNSRNYESSKHIEKYEEVFSWLGELIHHYPDSVFEIVPETAALYVKFINGAIHEYRHQIVEEIVNKIFSTKLSFENRQRIVIELKESLIHHNIFKNLCDPNISLSKSNAFILELERRIKSKKQDFIKSFSTTITENTSKILIKGAIEKLAKESNLFNINLSPIGLQQRNFEHDEEKINQPPKSSRASQTHTSTPGFFKTETKHEHNSADLAVSLNDIQRSHSPHKKECFILAGHEHHTESLDSPTALKQALEKQGAVSVRIFKVNKKEDIDRFLTSLSKSDSPLLFILAHGGVGKDKVHKLQLTPDLKLTNTFDLFKQIAEATKDKPIGIFAASCELNSVFSQLTELLGPKAQLLSLASDNNPRVDTRLRDELFQKLAALKQIPDGLNLETIYSIYLTSKNIENVKDLIPLLSRSEMLTEKLQQYLGKEFTKKQKENINRKLGPFVDKKTLHRLMDAIAQNRIKEVTFSDSETQIIMHYEIFWPTNVNTSMALRNKCHYPSSSISREDREILLSRGFIDHSGNVHPLIQRHILAPYHKALIAAICYVADLPAHSINRSLSNIATFFQPKNTCKKSKSKNSEYIERVERLNDLRDKHLSAYLDLYYIYENPQDPIPQRSQKILEEGGFIDHTSEKVKPEFQQILEDRETNHVRFSD